MKKDKIREKIKEYKEKMPIYEENIDNSDHYYYLDRIETLEDLLREDDVT